MYSSEVADREVAAAFTSQQGLIMPQVMVLDGFMRPTPGDIGNVLRILMRFWLIMYVQVRAAGTSTTPHYTIIDMVSEGLHSAPLIPCPLSSRIAQTMKSRTTPLTSCPRQREDESRRLRTRQTQRELSSSM